MAELRVDGDELVLHLTAFERAEAAHGDLRVPLSAVRKVEAVEEPLGEASGIRAGTGLPGVVLVATMYGSGGKRFFVVHHDTHRGVRVQFDGADYEAWIVGADNPESLIASLHLDL